MSLSKPLKGSRRSPGRDRRQNWATRYVGRNFSRGYIIKDEHTNTSAQDTQWLAFNIQRPIFADRRVRQAITLAFDFEWMNKALFYSAYQRANSYFPEHRICRPQPAWTQPSWVLLTPMKTNCPRSSSARFTSRRSPRRWLDRANLPKPTPCSMRRAGR